MLGPTESRSAKKTPSHSWSGKVQDRGSRKSSAKTVLSNGRSGKLQEQHKLKIGRERFRGSTSESRSAIRFIGVRLSVGKDMSVGIRFSRLDLPQ